VLAITTRPTIRHRLAQIAAGVDIPTPTFYACATEMIESAAASPLLFVDLGSCYADPRLEEALRWWTVRNPQSELVFFVPLIEREAETRLVFRLASIGSGRVMTESDFGRLEVWQNVKDAHSLALLRREIREDFLRAVEQTGRQIRAEVIVLQILGFAPGIVDLAGTTAVALAEPPSSLDAARKAVWSQLRRQGQMPASWLLLMFRLVWYAMLSEKGWSTNRIARFMGFRTTRDFRRTMRRRCGISMSQLKQLDYQRVLEWAAVTTTGGYQTAMGRSVVELIQPLVKSLPAVVVGALRIA
jgi:AcrR family transcriptional regulator